jgi:hypothetical protein
VVITGTGTGWMALGASLYTEGPENLTLLAQISPDHAVRFLVTVLMLFPQILEYSSNIAYFNTVLLISKRGIWVLYITCTCYKVLDMSDFKLPL